jgi:hypothetical protein
MQDDLAQAMLFNLHHPIDLDSAKRSLFRVSAG